MFPGWLQILLVVLLVILLFGRGKISDLMGDVAKGIRSRLRDFGRMWDFSGKSAEICPIDWGGPK